MRAYSYHEGLLPEGFTPGFEPALFNTPEFLQLQEPVRLISFYVLDTSDRKAIAALHVHFDNESAQSPWRAPFGSVEAVRRISPQVLYDFIAYVQRRVKFYGARELVIKNPPRAYDPEFVSLLDTFLANQDFVIATAEPGAVIAVDDRSFTERIASAQVSRRMQAKHAGFEFALLPPGDVGEVYDFIAACHESKEYKISISRQQLSRTVIAFPDHYVLSAIKERGTIRAAAVSIRVRRNILYNFLVNHDKDVNRLSPAIMLMEGLYEYCQKTNIDLFDLGTSALAGKPNFSLLDFKLRMGAVPTSKFLFYKNVG